MRTWIHKDPHLKELDFRSLCPFLARFEPTKWNCSSKNMSFLILFIQRHEADS
jgi:hypothetical protein